MAVGGNGGSLYVAPVEIHFRDELVVFGIDFVKPVVTIGVERAVKEDEAAVIALGVFFL